MGKICSIFLLALVLYYSPYCPYSRKVLNYLDQTHKTIPMKNVYEDPKYKEELREQGGKMLVPCLIINGKPLYNADAIIQWLSEHQDLLSDTHTRRHADSCSDCAAFGQDSVQAGLDGQDSGADVVDSFAAADADSVVFVA